MARKNRKMVEQLGIMLMFFSLVLFVLGLIMLMLGKQKSRIEGGGVIFIGPIPIIFGTSVKVVYFLMFVTLLFFLIFVFLFLTNFVIIR